MKGFMKSLVMLSLIATVAFTTGCGSSKKDGEGADSIAAAPEAAGADNFNFGVNDDSDSGKLPLKTVFFAYNSASLGGDTKATLDAGADYLKSNASVNVRIEGHCDERGSAQYNFALGENRAKAVKSYLVNKGVDAKRLEVISYGKERPLAHGHSEDSWSQNRRGNFVVTAK